MFLQHGIHMHHHQGGGSSVYGDPVFGGSRLRYRVITHYKYEALLVPFVDPVHLLYIGTTTT